MSIDENTELIRAFVPLRDRSGEPLENLVWKSNYEQAS